MTHDGLTRALRDLNDDWSQVAADGVPLPPQWRRNCPALRGVEQLSGLLDAVRADPDAVLLALLRLHRQGDVLAGRAVLQAMLGKVVRMAVRDAEHDFADYLAALWERIATYPVDRRPNSVAANLALDSLKAVKSSTRGPVAVLLADPVPPLVERDLRGEAVLDAGVQLGLIDAKTRRTLETVYLGGRTSAAAASELGTSADAVRWRCSRGVRALRSHARQLAAELAG